jgi:ATP-dependent exoDNAse (exonuclease V) alpha subunit
MLTINTLKSMDYYLQNVPSNDGGYTYYTGKVDQQRADLLEPPGFWLGGLRDRIIGRKTLVDVADFATVYSGFSLFGEQLRHMRNRATNDPVLRELNAQIKTLASQQTLTDAQQHELIDLKTKVLDHKQTDAITVQQRLGQLQKQVYKISQKNPADLTIKQRDQLKAAQDELAAYRKLAGQRAGVELTWSPPKCLSTYSALTDLATRATVDAICHDVMQDFVAEVERAYAYTREQTEDGYRPTQTQKLLFAGFQHEATRPVDIRATIQDLPEPAIQELYAQHFGPELAQRHKAELLAVPLEVGQPQKHFHMLCLNTTESLNDGKLKAFFSDYLKDSATRQLLDKQLNAKLADGLRQKLGLTIVPDATGTMQIVGVSKELNDLNSQRHDAIMQAYAAQGGGNKTLLALATRGAKQDTPPTATEFYGFHQTIAGHLGLNLEQTKTANADLAPGAIPSNAELLAMLTKQNAFFTETELKTALWQARTFAQFDVDAKLAEFMQDAELMAFVNKNCPGHSPIYTTKTLWQREQTAEQQVKLLNDTYSHRLNNVDQIIAARESKLNVKITDEQRAVIKTACQEQTNGLVVLNASAGTGKTFSAQFVKEIHEQNGYAVVGIAPSHAAKRALAGDLQADTYTLHRLCARLDRYDLDAAKLAQYTAALAYPTTKPHQRHRMQQWVDAFTATTAHKMQQGQKTLLIADEYGMVDYEVHSRLLNHITAINAKTGNNIRLMMQGDFNQLQPVGHGAAFARIVQQELATNFATMTEIRRQKVDWQNQATRNVAAAFAGKLTQEQLTAHIDAAINAYGDHGKIDLATDKQASIANLVKGYLADRTGYADKIVLASTNRNVNVLNSMIQTARQEKGELGTVPIKVGQQTYYAGDRVLFTREDEKHGFGKGKFGTIQNLQFTPSGGVSYEVKTDDGKVSKFTDQSFNQDNPPAFKLGYASTLHFAQGKTVSNTYFLDDAGFSNYQLFYIGVSRHKDDLRLYTTHAEMNTLAQRVANRAEKLNLMDLGIPQEITHQVQQATTTQAATIQTAVARLIPAPLAPMVDLAQQAVADLTALLQAKLPAIKAKFSQRQLPAPELPELEPPTRQPDREPEPQQTQLATTAAIAAATAPTPAPTEAQICQQVLDSLDVPKIGQIKAKANDLKKDYQNALKSGTLTRTEQTKLKAFWEVHEQQMLSPGDTKTMQELINRRKGMAR